MLVVVRLLHEADETRRKCRHGVLVVDSKRETRSELVGSPGGMPSRVGRPIHEQSALPALSGKYGHSPTRRRRGDGVVRPSRQSSRDSQLLNVDVSQAIYPVTTR